MKISIDAMQMKWAGCIRNYYIQDVSGKLLKLLAVNFYPAFVSPACPWIEQTQNKDDARLTVDRIMFFTKRGPFIVARFAESMPAPINNCSDTSMQAAALCRIRSEN